MAINSRQKGARGERLLRDVFIAHGFPSRRGQQFSGSPDSPDVIIPDLPWIHAECKFVENLNINKAMEQARRDAGLAQVPMVFHKKKNTEWLVTMDVEDFFELITKINDYEQKQKGRVCHCSSGDDGSGKVDESKTPDLG